MKALKRRTEGLKKLASQNTKGTVEMTLPYVALGDLRRRWRQKETPIHSALLRKLNTFKRIKISKDKSLRITGSDGGLLVYGVALNDKELVDNLYKSIQEAPTPKHYIFKGKKRSDYKQSWHSVGPEPIPDSNRTDKLRVSVGSVPPFLDSRSVRYFHSVGTQGH